MQVQQESEAAASPSQLDSELKFAKLPFFSNRTFMATKDFQIAFKNAQQHQTEIDLILDLNNTR